MNCHTKMKTAVVFKFPSFCHLLGPFQEVLGVQESKQEVEKKVVSFVKKSRKFPGLLNALKVFWHKKINIAFL